MEEELLSVTKKSSGVFLGKILGVIILFFFNFIVAREFGAEGYGEFTYVFTYVNFIPILSVMGLDQGLVFLLPRLKSKEKFKEQSSLIGFTFIIVIITWILIMSLVILNRKFLALALFDSPIYMYLISALIPLSLFSVLTNLISGIFRGFGNNRYNVVCENIIVPVSKTIIIVLLIILGKKTNAIIISTYISLIIGNIYLLKKLFSLKNVISFKFIKSTIYKEIIFFGLPVLMNGILGFFISRMSIFMIGHFLSSKDVGIYNVSLQIGGMSSFILIAFNTVFAPIISSLYYKKDMDKLSYMYKAITKWVVAINLVAFSLIILFSKDIMHLFGEEYIYGAQALIIIALGQVINAATGSVGVINNMTGHPEYEICISILVIMVGGFTNYFFIPILGINGAALASLIVTWLSNLIRLALVYRNHKMHPYNFEYIKVIGACFISFCSIYILKNMFHISWNIDLFLYSCLYIAIFLLVSIMLGLSEADKDIIERWKRSR